MAEAAWKQRRLLVTSLFLDERNPRLGRETGVRAPREIVQYLFDHSAMENIEWTSPLLRYRISGS